MKAKDQIISLTRKIYSLLIKVGNFFQPLVLLAFRLHWGWLFFKTGRGKLLNHERTVDFFTSLNIPLPDVNAWFVGGLECVGGLLLLVGLFSRPIAFMLMINMLVAYLSVPEDRAALLGIFGDPKPFFEAEPFFFLLTCVLVFSFGPGKLSLDTLLRPLLSKGNPTGSV